MKNSTTIIALVAVLACFESISLGQDIAKPTDQKVLDNPAAVAVQEADTATAAFLAEKLAMDERALRPERTAAPIGLASVQVEPLDQAIPALQGTDDEPVLGPDHPPLDQIPPAPMPVTVDQPLLRDPGVPLVYDAMTGKTVELPVGELRVGDPLRQPGFDGVAGNFDTEALTRTFWDMYQITNTEDHPWRMNVKVIMRFVDQIGNDRWFGCSGSMIDAETVLTAGHCVYARGASGPDIYDWAEEIWVYPGKDGSEHPYGYGHGTYFGAWTGWTSGGSFDYDLGLIRITRAVGMLTGWFGTAWDGSCSWILGQTYNNASYPGEGCPLPGLHNGVDMYYWFGNFDSCPGNQLQINTGGGNCFDTVWGGMSGSGAYYMVDDSRYVHAACSNSDRMWVGRYCKLWGNWATFMNGTFIPGSRGPTFDLQALDANAEPAVVPAGSQLSFANFLAANPTNGSDSGSWTVRTYLSTNSDISGGDTLLGTGAFNWTFPPMSSVWVGLGNPTIPLATPPGDYYFGVILDPATDFDPSNNDTDGWDAAPITVTEAPPPNDDCSDATVIPTMPIAPYDPPLLDTRGATSEATDPLQSCSSGGPKKNSNTVWYRYSPPCDGHVNISTCGTNYDTVLTVSTGSCGSLTEIACSDDACGYQSEIIGLAVEGQVPLYIEVSDYYRPGGGDLDFHLDFVPTPPPNDECDGAEWMGVPDETMGWTHCATLDVAPVCGDPPVTVTSPGVWYWVIGTGNTMTASTCNEFVTFDTKISVYCNNCDTLTCVNANDDNCTGYPPNRSTVSWCSQYGAEYLILVHSYGGQTGGFLLNVWDNDTPCTGAVECGGEAIGACCAKYACDEGGLCGAYENCGGDHDCWCFETAEGGALCSDTHEQWCSTLTPCPGGQADCSTGEVCVVNTCCSNPDVCIMPGCPLTREAVEETSPKDASGAMPHNGIAEEQTASTTRMSGVCKEIPQVTCEARGNLYEGDGTSCRTTVCPGPTGACCVDGVCVGTMEEIPCLRQQGEWFAGEDCDAGFVCPQPPPIGACCAPWVCTEGYVCEGGHWPVCNGTFGPCFCFWTVERELVCLDGWNQGCGEPCDTTADCPVGGPPYVCVIKTCCDTQGQAGVCLMEGCPLPALDGQVSAVGELKPVGDVSPEQQVLSERGIDPQACLDLEEPECDYFVGLYQGDDTTCEDTVCPGPPHACCLPEGRCVETNHKKCVDVGGDPQGPGTTCDMVQCDPIKWAQPPTFGISPQLPECFWGWDEPSIFGYQQIVADDWPCDSDQPVSDIHWWGSYVNWDASVPPEVAPKGFHIGVWTDVPAGAHPPFSHPGKLIHEWLVERGELNERPVGCDYFPDHPVDTCFRYDFIIPQSEWFFQEQASEIYWISIAAVYSEDPSRNPWGWKTRKHIFNDAAVRIYSPTDPRVPAEYLEGEPIVAHDVPWDMAFVLTSKLPQEACCLRDGSCIDIPPNECIERGGKPQGPGTACTVKEACCLSDDACINVDPLCCDDMGGIPQGAGTSCTAAEACCVPEEGTCRMLDPLCCMQLGGDPQGPQTVCTEPEGCCFDDGMCMDLDPLCCEAVGGTPQGPDTACVDTTIACCNRYDGSCIETDPLCCDDIGGVPSPIGSPVCLGDHNGNTIDDACEVPPQACCLADGECIETEHNDCVNRGGDPQGPRTDCSNTVCQPLKWVQPPVFNPNSEYPDCFWGWDEQSWYGGQQIVADDWRCDNTKPITDIHWWGSYYRWNALVPPEGVVKGFHIGIWTDVPATVAFSHPGEMVWEWVVDIRAVNEHAVGCDFFPDHSLETCFRYDLILPREKWFHQGPVCEVYWISIAAIHADDLGRTFWGWKTRKHMYNDAAVRVFSPTAPRPGAAYRDGEPIVAHDVPWDMAFVLTTTGATEACCLQDHVCLDVVREVCIEMGGKPQGEDTECTEPQACCLRDGTCIMVDPLCCDDFGGTPQGLGTQCTVEEACCLPDASCRMLDPLCCKELDGKPQGPDTKCTVEEACCLQDGSCEMLDPLCCAGIGGVPQGPDRKCTELEGCCFSDGTCADLDPLCCEELGGKPQGPDTGCVDTTIACCLQGGEVCVEVDPLCCDEMGGIPSPFGSPVCLGDQSGNGIDDACEPLPPTQACCLPDGTCDDTSHADCVERGGDPQGVFTTCDQVVCRPLKWAQPPVLNIDSEQPLCFWGWDEPSVFSARQIVADDWPCNTNQPVTDIHWWGSYVGWAHLEPPQIGPDRFHIGIWTDVPAGTAFSHPGEMIREWVVDRSVLNEQAVRCDFHPEHTLDMCFRYDLVLPEEAWFYQGSVCEIFWVSISAVYGLCPCNPDMNCDDTVDRNDVEAFELALRDPDGYQNQYPDCDIRQADVNCDGQVDSEDRQGFYCLLEGGSPEDCCQMVPEYVWGWKTRPHRFNDDAVRIYVPTAPGVGDQYEQGEPIHDLAGASWDMAFVLTTTGATEACCLQDQTCLDVVREVCIDMKGKPQGEGTECTEPQACCLTDDTCIMVDPLCCDEFGGTPQGYGTQCTVEEACCMQDGTCEMLDPLCCAEIGGVPQGPDSTCTKLEGCCFSDGACRDLDPLCCEEFGGKPQGPGTGCVFATIACCLQGGEVCVEVDPLCCDDIGGVPSPIGSPVCLGDENQNGIDDACESLPPAQACCLPDGTCVDTTHADCVERGGDPQGIFTLCDQLVCRPLKWAQPPVFNIDSPQPMCFWGWDEPSVFGAQQIVADDWPCDTNRPVTDIHWWGSYLGWAQLEPPPRGPDRFHIGIWTDVPAGAAFSHPGRMIWEWVVDRHALAERVVGCDFHEDQAALDACFRYNLILPEDVWFYQGPVCEIFWVSISAMYEDVVPTEYVWGWKTRPHRFNDDAVRIFVPTAPTPGDPFEQGEPIFDLGGASWDMAFVLTTDCPVATIVESHPRDGTVDARQPCTPAAALPRQGIGSPGAPGSDREPILIALDPPVSGAEHCFELCETKVDPVAGPNGIGAVTDLGGGKYEIVLLHAITAGGVTTIEYTGDGSYVAFISHPANVNADSMAAPPDILKVVDYINGAAVSPWGIYSEDVDHSNMLMPPDILRVIDLLNGAGVYDVWRYTPLPENTVCP